MRAVLAVAVVVLAACDSVPGGNADDDAPLSKDEFVEQANEICRASQSEAARIPAPSLADPAAVEDAILQSVAIHRRALRELRGLEPPETDVPGVRNWLRLVSETVDEMEALAHAIAAGDREAMTTAIDRGDALTADAEAFTEAYGIFACSTEEPPEGADTGEGDPGDGGSTTTTTTTTTTG
ncbi:MAG TPA: hypothetical protein VF152_13590 [Acidimicrobiia bacterium]